LPSGRIAVLGATMDLHHGLLGMVMTLASAVPAQGLINARRHRLPITNSGGK
jgi:hypothetical protein